MSCLFPINMDKRISMSVSLINVEESIRDNKKFQQRELNPNAVYHETIFITKLCWAYKI